MSSIFLVVSVIFVTLVLVSLDAFVTLAVGVSLVVSVVVSVL